MKNSIDSSSRREKWNNSIPTMSECINFGLAQIFEAMNKLIHMQVYS
jgi:hypothetical protein